ncbi:MAG: hypothetical protein ACOCUW_01230 [Gemmatimonadota bacterium]
MSEQPSKKPARMTFHIPAEADRESQHFDGEFKRFVLAGELNVDDDGPDKLMVVIRGDRQFTMNVVMMLLSQFPLVIRLILAQAADEAEGRVGIAHGETITDLPDVLARAREDRASKLNRKEGGED